MSYTKRPLTVEQATNRAAALCARSEQAPADITDKLMKWGLSASDAARVTQQLIEGGFLNEQRFARAFVKDRFAFNGWGKSRWPTNCDRKVFPATSSMKRCWPSMRTNIVNGF